MRSVKSAHSAINQLVNYFGDIAIKKIDDEMLENYKKTRLATGIKIATVNRELAKARRMFTVAKTKHWLQYNPFDSEKSLIQVSAERPKERVVTDDEEQAFFSTLQHPDRKHTVPVFIAAFDTGARYSSLVTHLKWKHINFAREQLTLTTYKDRNIKQWEVPMTSAPTDVGSCLVLHH